MNAPSTRRYLSLWLRRLSTDRIERRSSAPADTPLVVVASVKGAQRITALNDAAARLGLKTGMALADARAMYPALPVAEADPEADRRLLEAIADWCDRYTPLVGLDPPDGLLLDITGCAHLFGGEAALCRDLVARLARQGFHARAAVADTVGCAWAVARYGDDAPIVAERRDRGSRLAAAARGAADRCRTPSPRSRRSASSASPISPSARARRSPRASARARAAASIRRSAANDEPITPRLPVPAAMAEQRFPDPIAREDDVLGTIEHLARELARVLERRGEGARLMQARAVPRRRQGASA